MYTRKYTNEWVKDSFNVLDQLKWLFSCLNRDGYHFFIWRDKKFMDLTIVLYTIELFVYLISEGYPCLAAWWVDNGVGIVEMALVGEQLCTRKEQRYISIKTHVSKHNFFYVLYLVICIFYIFYDYISLPYFKSTTRCFLNQCSLYKKNISNNLINQGLLKKIQMTLIITIEEAYYNMLHQNQHIGLTFIICTER